MPVNSGLTMKVTNDKMPSASLKSKTVECRLKRTYERLAETEANIQLFIKLKGMGLATNDVSSFVKKQVIHKRVIKCPDTKVLKASMQSKLIDAVAFAKKLRVQRDNEKSKLSKIYSSCKSRGRRVLEALYEHYREHRMKEMLSMRSKIDHYIAREKYEKSIKNAPENTREFLYESLCLL